LGVMVCNLTIGKKKYIEVEPEIKNILSEIATFSDKFVELGKNDNAAFDAVMDAFKLPKETDEQKAQRHDSIEAATLGAAAVPAQVISLCSTLLPYLGRIAQIGNQNSLSDAAIGISLTKTAAEGAYMNVLINCSALASPDKYAGLLAIAQEEYELVAETGAKLISDIIEELKPVTE
ncbi:MAG: cyclodeaminase/cyclohydrolase family protein, partial [Ignavibacteriales bacterium]|nr:cyclodeaminase/cyclohydrolase family protein [Ignavibacteriales bacterium]